MDTIPIAALQRAITLAGGQSALARALSNDARAVKQGHVWSWLNRGSVPIEFALPIETATAGSVRCEDLRPDVTWQRADDGTVTGYVVPVSAPETGAR